MGMTQTMQRVSPTIMTPEEMRERDRILSGRYFIVRQGTIGEYMRCKGYGDRQGCGTKHTYLTLMCVERPFSSVMRGLYAWYRLHPGVGMGRDSVTTDDERRKLSAMDKALFRGAPPPSLDGTHPDMARALRAGDEYSYDVGGTALGIIEPITTAKARDLVQRINMRAGRDLVTMDTLDKL